MACYDPQYYGYLNNYPEDVLVEPSLERTARGELRSRWERDFNIKIIPPHPPRGYQLYKLNVVVLGDVTATQFRGYFTNRQQATKDMCDLRVNHAVFPYGVKPSIFNIEELLAAYSFPHETDVFIISLLHCDLLTFDPNDSICLGKEISSERMDLICARYAALYSL